MLKHLKLRDSLGDGRGDVVEEHGGGADVLIIKIRNQEGKRLLNERKQISQRIQEVVHIQACINKPIS
jgi:hypothetical protein